MDCENCVLKQFAINGKLSIRRQSAMRHKLRFVLSHPVLSYIDKELFSSPTTLIFDRFITEEYDIVLTKQCIQACQIGTGAGSTAMERSARASCEATLKADLVGAEVIVACGNEALQALGYSRKAGNSVGWVDWNEELQATVMACLDPHQVEDNSDSLAKDWIWTVQHAEKIVRGLAPKFNIAPDPRWDKIDTLEKFKDATGGWEENDYIILDIETTGLNWRKHRILQLGLHNHTQNTTPLVIPGELLKSKAFRDYFNENIGKFIVVMHNGKFDAKFLHQLGLFVKIGYDTLVIHHMIDERTGIHGLDRLARVYRNYSEYWANIDKYYAFEDGLGNAPFEEVADYLSLDLILTGELLSIFLSALRDDRLSKKYPWEIMMSQKDHIDMILNPVNNALLEVELKGFNVNKSRLDYLTALAIPSVEARKREIEQWFYEQTGQEFSVDSPVQLLKAFHLVGALPKEIESTDAKILKNHSSVEIINRVLEYKKEVKILTSFYNSTQEHLFEIDDTHHVINPTFNLGGTICSRWSAANINVQQAPRKPHPFKSIFIPSPGHIIFQNDFSSLEVCMAAFLSRDLALAEACSKNMHMTVARNAFVNYFAEFEPMENQTQLRKFLDSYSLLLAVKKSILEKEHEEGKQYSVGQLKDAITDHLRSCAKTITFGIFFGRGARALAEQELKCSVTEAQEFIDNYFKLFPGLDKFIRKIHYLVRDIGIIVSPDGRIRDLRSWMFSSDPMKRKWALARACRQAVNFLTQNMAGTVNNIAFIKADRYLKEHGVGRMMGAVHDSSVGEIIFNKDTRMHLLNIKELQDNCLQSDIIKFRVDNEAGFNWCEVMKLDKFLDGIGGDLIQEIGLEKATVEKAQARLTAWKELDRIEKMTEEQLVKEGLDLGIGVQLQDIISGIDREWELLKV